MAECVVKQRKTTRVCIGSLNKRVDLELRAITAPNQSGVDFGESFTNTATVWAMIETVTGKTMFDKSNIETVITHNFYIRFVQNIEIDTSITYDGRIHIIINIENFGENNGFLVLHTTIRGTDTLTVNEF